MQFSVGELLLTILAVVALGLLITLAVQFLPAISQSVLDYIKSIFEGAQSTPNPGSAGW